MIFFTTAALCKNRKIIINSFGATNVPKHLRKHELLNDLEIPVRDDGAKFEGWYYSLNFDHQFRADICEEEALVINAKYDKCYCFTLRYNILGCFGKYDENIKENEEDYKINYFIPKGEYKVTFTDFSKAKKGVLTVLSNDKYTEGEGYQVLEQYEFDNVGKSKKITIKEGTNLSLNENSVFMFQRVDVDPKYTHYRID